MESNSYDFDNEDILNISKIQSIYRRYYVQNEMKKLRKEYEDIVVEIEGENTDSRVIWPNEEKLCYPKFTSKKTPKSALRPAATVTTSEITNKDIECKVDVIKFDVIDEKQLDYLKEENLKKLNSNELVELKENVSLEILWIQQAIQSRIQYLNLKKTIEEKKRSSK